MLKGKCVVLGVTGSIAAYKIAYLASALVKQHADVHVIMTENATNFINPITFETLTSNKCLVDTFDRNFQFNVEHVALAKRADIFMVAPASANVIGKMANGIADDMLTTTILAAKCPKYVSPAMNTNMFENPIVQDNIKKLGDYGFHIIDPASGYLACGDTGAGKTTIVNLISRFYDIQKGRILIDDYDLKKVSIESLRHQMGVMTQDNFLFSGTIRENIRYGRLNATDEEIVAAAKAVNAHDFIMKLEKGYDTELSERGGGLSIGQKQLLAFARTMVSDPRILILDEATSSIDTNTELLVQEGIEHLLKGRTSFVIAHRLSTIQKADRIFVIDDGRIIEEGNAQELMAKKGFYYDLYMSQFKNVM